MQKFSNIWKTDLVWHLFIIVIFGKRKIGSDHKNLDIHESLGDCKLLSIPHDLDLIYLLSSWLGSCPFTHQILGVPVLASEKRIRKTPRLDLPTGWLEEIPLCLRNLRKPKRESWTTTLSKKESNVLNQKKENRMSNGRDWRHVVQAEAVATPHRVGTGEMESGTLLWGHFKWLQGLKGVIWNEKCIHGKKKNLSGRHF